MQFFVLHTIVDRCARCRWHSAVLRVRLDENSIPWKVISAHTLCRSRAPSHCAFPSENRSIKTQPYCQTNDSHHQTGWPPHDKKKHFANSCEDCEDDGMTLTLREFASRIWHDTFLHYNNFNSFRVASLQTSITSLSVRCAIATKYGSEAKMKNAQKFCRYK